MSYHTAVFDLDGTLLDTLQDLAESVNYALNLNGLPERSLDEVRSFVGNGVARLVGRAVPEGTAPELESQCLAGFRAHYLRNMERHTAPYPGVLSLLRRLRDAGCKLAVVSNKFDGAVKQLCRRYFEGLIPVAIGACADLAAKPAPDAVFKALSELGAGPSGAVYIGDSDVDLQTAKNAGLPCISVSWGFRDRAFLLAHGALHIVDGA